MMHFEITELIPLLILTLHDLHITNNVRSVTEQGKMYGRVRHTFEALYLIAARGLALPLPALLRSFFLIPPSSPGI